MPTRPLRACRMRGCPALVVEGYCPTHGGPEALTRPWARPSSAAGRRLRGSAWMKLRRQVLSEEPRCYLCGAFAQHDDIVDHRRPLAGGGGDERENLARCCRLCHKMKTGQESALARPNR